MLVQTSHAVETDLQRILALKKRPVLDCERDALRRWSPAAAALIDIQTSKYTRGPRLSCNCRKRIIQSTGNGNIVVFHTAGRKTQAPPAPVEMSLAAFCADNVHDVETCKLVAGLRTGQTVELPGLDAPFCLTELNAVQAWILQELPVANGIFGLVSVGGGKCLPQGVEIFDISSAKRRDISEVGPLVVPSLSDRIVAQRAMSFASGAKECVRVELADGTHLLASNDHPVLTSTGWCHAGALRSEQFVAVANHIPEPSSCTVATDDEVIMAAYLLSDGGCNDKWAAGFTNETPAVIDEFLELSNRMFGSYREARSKTKARQFYVRGTASIAFRQKWSLYGLAIHKRLHPTLWGLPHRQVRLFLNRFWACDGYFNKDKGVEIVLGSEKMIDDLQFMLLRLGIRARKKYKESCCDDVYFDAWRLTASGHDAETFIREVGDILGKEESSQKLRLKLSSTKRNTNTDIVPFGDKEFGTMCDELGMAPLGYSARLVPGRPRSTLRKLLHVTQGQYVSRAKFIEVCRKYSYTGSYSHLANTDLRWERVTSNETIGVRPVFDVEVAETHNFVANGMIVHNTAAGILAPLAMHSGVKSVMLLAKPNQRIHYKNAYLRLREHFRVPSFVLDESASTGTFIMPGTPVLRFVSYSELSSPKSTRMLETINPDAFISDECHRFSNRRATGSMRWIRHMSSRSDIVFCCWSGSMIKKKISDAAHLSAHALGLGSPYPISTDTVDKWSNVIDPSYKPDSTSTTAIDLYSALANVRTGGTNADDLKFLMATDEVKQLREAFRERVISSVGVVSTMSSSVSASISIMTRKAEVPDTVYEALKKVRQEGESPDEEVLVTPLEQVTCARNVAAGFHEYWAYPRGEPVSRIIEWKARRKIWFKELRGKVHQNEPHLDSSMLCTNAAKRGYQEPPYKGPLPIWQAKSWPEWEEIKDTVDPSPRVRWLDDYLAQDAAAWAREHKGVVWCQSRAMGLKIAEILGLAYHAGGPKGEALLHADIAKNAHTVVCSIPAYGTGFDSLQHRYSKQLIVEPPASADGFQQLLGRLCREGQDEETVETWVYRHVPEYRDAIDQAIWLAEYIEASTPNKQLILAADKDWE